MIRAVIFDCFGVLITDGMDAAVQEAEKTKPDARNYISDLIRQTSAGILDTTVANTQIAQYLDMDYEKWRSVVAEGEVKNKALFDWILELKKSYKTAVLSNAGKGSLARRFTELEMQSHFDEILVSGDVGIVKPDADIYRLITQRLEVEPSECVFFDDRIDFVEGANAIGMHGFMYSSVGQAKIDFESVLEQSKA